MNPLRELRNLVVASSVVETGTVASVMPTFLSVRSRNGLKSFSISDANNYRPGDTVRFQGNILLGKAVSLDAIPVFRV